MFSSPLRNTGETGAIKTSPSPLRRFGRRAVSMAAVLALASAMATPAPAQVRGGFIRDAEIEALLSDYTVPILRAAGVGASAVQIYLIASPTFNAFVADGRRIFINSGVLMQAKTPNEVIGVMAHETGHIAGGHLARMRSEIRGAQAMSVLTMLLGAGAMAAGAMAGAGGTGAQAGQALMLGGQHMANRSLLSYRRSEESSADRAAVNYLNATGQSTKGMLETFSNLASQSFLSTKYTDPYAVSHPMPRERIAALEQLARQSPHYEKKDPPALQHRHNLARAKLHGYLEHPSSVARRYPRSDNSVAANYARTISKMRSGSYRDALSGTDRLIRAEPNNPYFHELKGDLLVKAGRPREAIAPYQRAVSMAPRPGLIRVALGGALVATGDQNLLGQGIRQLNQGLQAEPDFATGYRQLAIAYGKSGRVAEAELATAQEHFARGDHELAKRFAGRAQQGLKHGSPAWLRADDILKYRPPRT